MRVIFGIGLYGMLKWAVDRALLWDKRPLQAIWIWRACNCRYSNIKQRPSAIDNVAD